MIPTSISTMEMVLGMVLAHCGSFFAAGSGKNWRTRRVMAQEVWLVSVLVSYQGNEFGEWSACDVHQAEEDEEEQLLDFRALVFHFEQRGERYADDHDACNDIDGMSAKAELRQVDAAARCLGEVGFLNGGALENADDGCCAIVYDNHKGGDVYENARDADSEGVGTFEELCVDKAE